MALEKINELNRKVTRLAEMMYRWQKPLWTITRDALGGQATTPIVMGDSANVVELGDEDYVTAALPVSDVREVVKGLRRK